MSDSDEVADELRAAILRGEFSPLQRLVEADLVEAYSTSRFVVRRALLQLQAEGLVELRKNRGARVQDVSIDAAVQLMEVQGVIDGFVAARAAERVTPEQITELQAIAHELTVAVKSVELQRYCDLSNHFYQRLREIADHEQASRMLEQLTGQTARQQLTLTSAPGRPMVSLREQLAVIDAVCLKNPTDAEAAMRTHINSVIDVLKGFGASPGNTTRSLSSIRTQPWSMAMPAPAASQSENPRTEEINRYLFSGIDETPDITAAYAGESPSQILDLYRPKDQPGPFPLIIAMHGGAFAIGDRTWDLRHLPMALARGYAVASLDYRLSGEATFPAAVLDVKAATAFLRSHAEEYDLDPSWFVAWGRSAGGNLAAMLGATCGRVTEFDLPNRDASIAAAVDWFGPVDFLQMDAQFIASPPSGHGAPPQNHSSAQSPESHYLGAPIRTVPAVAARANPITWVNSAPGPLPPFFLAAGTNDRLVPYQQTLLLADALRRHGDTPMVHILTDAEHADLRFEQELTGPVFDWLETLRTNA